MTATRPERISRSLGDTGFFGFKFTRNGGADTHYGWGRMTIPGSATGGGFSVLEAYDEDVPDQPIAVGALPPAPPAPPVIDTTKPELRIRGRKSIETRLRERKVIAAAGAAEELKQRLADLPRTEAQGETGDPASEAPIDWEQVSETDKRQIGRLRSRAGTNERAFEWVDPKLRHERAG